MVESVNQVVTVLSKEQLAILENQLPRMVVTNQTTPIEIATALGVQMVLKKLREGFTYG